MGDGSGGVALNHALGGLLQRSNTLPCELKPSHLLLKLVQNIFVRVLQSTPILHQVAVADNLELGMQVLQRTRKRAGGVIDILGHSILGSDKGVGLRSKGRGLLITESRFGVWDKAVRLTTL